MKASLLVTIAILAFGLRLSQAEASHPWAYHIGTIHSGYSVANEAICLDNESAYSISTGLSNISQALWLEGDVNHWDSLSPHGDGYRLYFVQMLGGYCDSLTAGERNAVEIEYFMWDGNEAEPCIWPSSCVPVSGFTGPYFQYGHTDYSKVVVNLYGPYLVGASGPANYYRHQVNHETGHAIGFNDGFAGTGCASASIMHYDCSDFDWPTANDVNAAVELADPN